MVTIAEQLQSIARGKEQATQAQQQVSQYKQSIPTVTQRLLRAVGFAQPLQAQQQRVKIKQANEMATRAEQDIQSYNQGVNEYETQFNQYLQSDSGKLQFAQESGLKPVAFDTREVSGFQIKVPIYETPYGQVTDESVYVREAKQILNVEAKQLGFNNYRDMQDAQKFGGTYVTSKGYEVNFDKGIVTMPTSSGREVSPGTTIQDLKNNLPTFTPQTGNGVQDQVNFQPYQQSNNFKSSVTGFATGVPLVSAKTVSAPSVPADKIFGQDVLSKLGLRSGNIALSSAMTSNKDGNVNVPNRGIIGNSVSLDSQQQSRTGLGSLRDIISGFNAKINEPTKVSLGGENFRVVSATPTPSSTISTLPSTNVIPEYQYQRALGNMPQIGGTTTGFVAGKTIPERVAQLSSNAFTKTLGITPAEVGRNIKESVSLSNIAGISAGIESLGSRAERKIVASGFGNIPTQDVTFYQPYSGTIETNLLTGKTSPYKETTVTVAGYNPVASAANIGVQSLAWLGPLQYVTGASYVARGVEGFKKPATSYGPRPEGVTDEEWADYQKQIDKYNRMQKIGAGLDIGLGALPFVARGSRALFERRFTVVEEPGIVTGLKTRGRNVMAPAEVEFNTASGKTVLRGFQGSGESEVAMPGRRVILSSRIQDWLGLKPTYAGRYTGDTLYKAPSLLFPGGRAIEISAKEARAGYKKALELLQDRGLSEVQARSYLRRVAPQTILSESSYRGLAVMPESEKLNVLFQGTRTDIPQKKFSFLSIGNGRGLLSVTKGGKARVIQIGTGFEELKTIVPKNVELGDVGEKTLFGGISKEFDPLASVGKRTRTFKEIASAKKVAELKVDGQATREQFKVKSASKEVTIGKPRDVSLNKADVTVVSPEVRARQVYDFKLGLKSTFVKPTVVTDDLFVSQEGFTKVAEEELSFRLAGDKSGLRLTVDKKTPWSSSFPKSELPTPSPKIETKNIVEATTPSLSSPKSSSGLRAVETNAPFYVGGTGRLEETILKSTPASRVASLSIKTEGPNVLSLPRENAVIDFRGVQDIGLGVSNVIVSRIGNLNVPEEINKLENPIKNLDKQIQPLDTKLTSKQVSKVETRLSNKQESAQVSVSGIRSSTKLRTRANVKPRLKLKPRLPSSDLSLVKRSTSKISKRPKQSAYELSTRVRGKERIVASGLSERAALDIGTIVALRGGKNASSLSASIILRKTSGPIRNVQTRGEFAQYKNIFRPGKVQARGSELTLVQKDFYRLGTREERTDIQRARKGGVFSLQ